MKLYCIMVFALVCFVCGQTQGSSPSPAEDEYLSRRIRSLPALSEMYLKHSKSLQPGQVMPHMCAYSKYGCCKDDKTFAQGSNGKGCDMILCTDRSVGYCLRKRILHKLNCAGRDGQTCCFSCRKCRPRAPPISQCLQKRPINGCCWDGKIPLRTDAKDCSPCTNTYPKTCRTFEHVSGGCNSGSFGIRNFMMTHCPQSCGFCSDAQRSHKSE